jgi:hypothetical protein
MCRILHGCNQSLKSTGGCGCLCELIKGLSSRAKSMIRSANRSRSRGICFGPAMANYAAESKKATLLPQRGLCLPAKTEMSSA